MVCTLYCRLQCEAPDERTIFGEIEFNRVGDLEFTRLRSNGRRVWLPFARAAEDDGQNCVVLVQREGVALLSQGGREAVVRPGDFVFHDCARPYELRFQGDEHALCALRLSRNHLQTHVGNLEDLTAVTVSGQCAAGQLLLSMVDTLSRDVDKLHPSSVMGVSEGITSIIAAGLRSLPGANVRGTSNLAAFHVARIKEHVRRNLRDPELSLATIAAAVGLSPDHVSRLFRAQPVPLTRLIWQLRLEACRRDLCDPRLAGRSVSDIAFSWGYNDAAHFSRSFREQHGIAPREWRQRALGVSADSADH